MLTFISTVAIGHPREAGTARFPWLLWLVAALVRLRYWTFGHLADAARIAWRGDTAVNEFYLGTLTMLLGAWWIVFPQPYSNVFGYITDICSGGAAPIFGLFMIAVGRNMVGRLVHGTSRQRIGSSRWAFATWLFLFLNQVSLNWSTVGTLIFLYNVGNALWIHERIGDTMASSRRSPDKKETI